eukprot:TRINITY_DN103718_c0_g1_i1.p1 TRINITY_DN103718_c0_g1~~TRINITY_DN103718_c0_g1_i1.p1  ORF type:complete len:649 (+),score=229.03 TRINITY_DN103718_c0_g1_i1:152-2098(+)
MATTRPQGQGGMLAVNGGPPAAPANPFSMPPEMEQFWLHNIHQQNDVGEAQRKDARIWEKSTQASRYCATRMLRDEELPMAPVPPRLQKELEKMRGKVLETETPDNAFLTTIAVKPSVGVVEPLRKEERDLRKYVQMKREVFLVQMGLDVKKHEIARLDEMARAKEEALAKSQQQLDEDKKKFEDFLQGRYSRAQTSTKEALKHAKAKEDKLAKIKQIRQQIAGLQSEIGKLREVREECARYRTFLDYLTPPEWKAEQSEKKKARKAARKEDYVAERMESVNEKLAEEEARLEASDKAEQERKKNQRKRGGRSGAQAQEEEEAQREKDRVARRKKVQKRRDDEERRCATEYDAQEVSSEEEPELYFKEPRQLMDTFTELEEKNLFLIEKSQETEQQLDELQSTFSATRKEMSGKVHQLNENIRNLQANIAQEKRQCDHLRKSLEETGGTEAQDKKLGDLFSKVHDVHSKCGLNDDHDPDILQMLGAIESKLEELIHGLDEAFHQDGELVMTLEKQKERERRERVRALKLREQTDKQEERLKNSLLRSQAPVFKKAGKQVMYRSPPPRTEKKVTKDTGEDEKKAHEHAVFGMYIDRKTQRPCTEAPVVEAPHSRREDHDPKQVAGDTTLDPSATIGAATALASVLEIDA